MKRIVQKPPVVKKALADFDLTDDAIAKFARYARAESSRLPANSPANAWGLTFYIWFVGLLRDYLVGLNVGWTAETVGGVEVVEHAGRKIRIAYLSGETRDGDLISSYRGPTSIALAEKNGQLLLLGPEFLGATRAQVIPFPSRTAPVEYKTWFLAVREEHGRYRIELVLPTESDGTRFVEWRERIAIADVQLDSVPNLDAVPMTAAASAAPKPTRRRKSGEDEAANDLKEGTTGKTKQ